jgi:ketosteroid isomerase-like protein
MKMWKYIFAAIVISSCGNGAISENDNAGAKSDTAAVKEAILQIGVMLDAQHLAAANADVNAYFGHFADDAIFIGTDASERWDKETFRKWSMPYFDAGKAWSFRSVDRNITIDKSGEIAWFDELLSTQMKICRGSGVAVKENGIWKVKHYVLSMTVPNSVSDTVVAFKSPLEDAFLDSLFHHRQGKTSTNSK